MSCGWNEVDDHRFRLRKRVGSMKTDECSARAELQRLLTAALEVADTLDLTLVGIHIDEARNLLLQRDVPVH